MVLLQKVIHTKHNPAIKRSNDYKLYEWVRVQDQIYLIYRINNFRGKNKVGERFVLEVFVRMFSRLACKLVRRRQLFCHSETPPITRCKAECNWITHVSRLHAAADCLILENTATDQIWAMADKPVSLVSLHISKQLKRVILKKLNDILIDFD